MPATPRTPVTAKTPAAPPPNPAWQTAERIAEGLRSRVVIDPADATGSAAPGNWLDVLTPYADGDTAMAGKVYDVLTGWHLIGELWRDEDVHEVHVRGTRITTCGPRGMHEVPGFPNRAAARRALGTIAADPDADAVVAQVGGSTVVTRPHRTGPDPAALAAAGVVTTEQLAQVERALEDMRAVTVTGPAAPVVVRALASLVPTGSRVFEGPFGVLPAGCVAAASPLDADYVIGVRPGDPAEEMAAAGHIGALIANPATPFPAALRFSVSGRSSAPGQVTAS